MPKDRAEVQDQYKIGGGSLNEFEFDRSKGEMEEQEHQAPEQRARPQRHEVWPSAAAAGCASPAGTYT